MKIDLKRVDFVELLTLLVRCNVILSNSSSTLILQPSFHIQLVSEAASTQELITVRSDRGGHGVCIKKVDEQIRLMLSD